MNARTKWLLAAGVAAVVAIAFFFLHWSPSSTSAEAPNAEARSGALGSAGSAASPAGPGSPGSAASPGSAPAQGTSGSSPQASAAAQPGAASQVPGMAGPGAAGNPSAPRSMPYRPAKFLRYSEDAPAADPSKDDASPVVQRIVQVTQAEPAQEKQIRELWRQHEDARRTLLAGARPRLSGPPILDPAKLGPIDFQFEAQVLSRVLRPDQRDRLVREVYPQ